MVQDVPWSRASTKTLGEGHFSVKGRANSFSSARFFLEIPILHDVNISSLTSFRMKGLGHRVDRDSEIRLAKPRVIGQRNWYEVPCLELEGSA